MDPNEVHSKYHILKQETCTFGEPLTNQILNEKKYGHTMKTYYTRNINTLIVSKYNLNIKLIESENLDFFK